MAGLALFDLLQDFGKRPQSVVGFEPARTDPLPPAVAQPHDIGLTVKAAVEQAEAALAERLRAEHEAALEGERQSHSAEIDAMLRRFGENAGELIVSRIAEMEARIGDLAASGAARILGSVLSEELQKRSIESLSASIREAAGDAEAVRIEVRGPQSLFESLRSTLAGHTDNLHFIEAPGLDLNVRIDGDLFETRLSEWSAALSEILS